MKSTTILFIYNGRWKVKVIEHDSNGYYSTYYTIKFIFGRTELCENRAWKKSHAIEVADNFIATGIIPL